MSERFYAATHSPTTPLLFPVTPLPSEATFTTFTIFRYDPPDRFWAFGQMAWAPSRLSQVPGLTFFKLMGSGQGLVFSLRPDWSRYALLATWQSVAHARAFFDSNAVMTGFRKRAAEVWTLHLYPTKAEGRWSGTNPFRVADAGLPPSAPVAILTRASIRPRALRQFWKNAPLAAMGLAQAPGLLFSCGVGEWPFVRQATVSVWENLAAMRSFAYAGPAHQQVMRRKVTQDWYSEELFARFVLVGAEGSYLGKNPLEKYGLTSPIHPTVATSGDVFL